MAVGLKEKAVILLVALGVVAGSVLLFPWWMAIIALLVMIPVILQLNRLGPDKRKAKRPDDL